MATNFDELVDSVTEPKGPPVPASAPKNSFDSLVDSVSGPDSSALHSSLFGAQNSDPAAEAERLKKARQLDIHPELVTSDAKAQVRQKLNDPEEIARTSPGTAKFLSNPDNAKIAVDGVQNLRDMEDTTSKVGPSRVLTSAEFTQRVKDLRAQNPALTWDNARQLAMQGTIIVDDQTPRIGESRPPVGNFSNFFTGQVAGLKSVGEQVRQSISRQVADLFDLFGLFDPSTVQSDSAAKVRRAQFEYSLARPQYDAGWMNDIYRGTEIVVQNVPGMAAAILLKNPQLALSLGTGLTQTLAYNKYRDRGGSVGEASLGAALEGALEYVTGLIPVKFLAENVGKIPVWKLVAANQGQEQVQEQIATVTQDFVDFAIANPDKTFGQYLAERPEAARQTAIAVALQSGVVAVAGAMHKIVTDTPEVRQTVQDTQRAYRADLGFQTLTALTEKAAKDTTRALDGQTFHDFVRTMTDEQQTLKEVYVDAKVLANALEAKGPEGIKLLESMPEVATQLQEAMATGGQVSISTADYLTHIAPTAVAQTILPELRIEPDGMTYNEAQAFYQEAKAKDEETLKKLDEKATPVLTREEFEAQRAAEMTTLANTVSANTERVLGAENASAIGEAVTSNPGAVQAIGEALAGQSTMPATYEEYLAQHPNKQAVRAREVNTVHNAILSELNRIGRFPRQVNAAYAVPLREFYAQNADRLKISPTELYSRIPVRFAMESMFGRDSFNQPEQNATLEDFGPKKIKDILTKFNWAIVTAENPNNTYTPDENAARMDALRRYLDDNGITYKEVDGFYDRPEKSVILLNTTPRQALDIGRMFDQESVLTRDGFVYQDGSVTPTTGEVFVHEQKPENYFTSIPDMGSMFTLGLDFDTRLSPTEHRIPDLMVFEHQTETPAFKKWFGDSKVVDADGKPLVVYHSSTFGDFDTFDKTTQRKGMAGYGFYFTDQTGANLYADYGLNFQADRDWQGNVKKVNVMPVFLSMQNPLIVDSIADVYARYGQRDPGQFGQGRVYSKMPEDAKTAIQRDGYDGVIAREYAKRMRDGSYRIVEPGTKGAIAHPVYVVFEPSQIKSAIGNRGTFDPNSANILYQDGSKLGEVSVTGEHFSREQREILDGRRYGTGIKGAEADRVYAAKDSRLRSRLYFYVDEGKGVFPESGVGRFKHTVRLDNMYDGARNPQKFPKKNANGEVDFNLFESAVLDAGFDGYYIEAGFHRQGVAVLLGDAAHGVKPMGETFAQTSDSNGAIEARLVEKLKNFDAAVAEYKSLPDSYGGKVINTDVARELSPDYLADRTRSAAVHEPASQFTKDYYALKLQEQPAEGELPLVLFTAGGTGAGKTTGLKVLGNVMDLAQIVYDTNMNSYDSSKKKIEQALAAGKFVRIVLVQRHPIDALINGAIPRAIRQKEQFGTGRTVPLTAHAETHIGAADTVARLRDEYKNDPRVRVEVIDNTQGPGQAKVVADITKMDYNDLHLRLKEALDEQHQAGKIPTELYQGFAEGSEGLRREARGAVQGGSEQFYQPAQGWYYSQLARTVAGAKTDSLPAGQWKAWLTANAGKYGVKKAEIQWTGLTDWLDLQQGKITKAQIADYLNANGVQVEEVMLGSVDMADVEAWWNDEGGANEEVPFSDLRGPQRREAVSRYREEVLNYAEEGATQYHSYVLPGGENYRELLLTLPPSVELPEGFALKQSQKGYWIVNGPGPLEENQYGSGNTPEEALRAFAAYGHGKDKVFRSAHWNGTPNILAHIRFNERTDAEGKRVLFIEEIQSDWGQKGKMAGFYIGEPEELKARRALSEVILSGADEDTVQAARDRLAIAIRSANYEQTPAAPFVTDTKSWTALALKRMIAYAAENGFDKIAWTTGEQQAARYDLSKQIEEIQYDSPTPEGKRYVTAIAVNGERLLGGVYSESELEDAVGKEITKKIVNNEGSRDVGEPAGFGRLTGIDLKVGGEGMKGYYDKIVPQVANDVLKKLGGGTIEASRIKTRESFMGGRYGLNKNENSTWDVTSKSDGTGDILSANHATYEAADQARYDIYEAESKGETPQPGFTITEELKAKVLEGLPLFQKNIGSFDPNSLTISLLNGANLSTVLHESGHFYLRALELMAQMPEATPEVKADWQKVMDWFGTTSEQWSAMSVDEQRPYHEQWAQSQERWMLEGKSPSLEMQPIFSRFRSWLLSVYKSVEAFLLKNPLAGKLNDEIREVFSRLIASEKAIEQAQLARNYAPLPKTEGSSDTEYADYLARHEAATSDAMERLDRRSIRDMRWLSNARSRIVRGLQREAASTRKAIKAEVTREVMTEPVNQARTWLLKGEMVDPNTGDLVKAAIGSKLNSEMVKAMYPESALSNPDLSLLRGMTSPKGLDPEVIARMFGFASGDQLIRALTTAEDTTDKINGITDQRMLEQHGELVDQRAIEEAADEAIHNEARARFMATGLKMLTNSPISAYQLAKAAKEAAENTVSGKKVRDLRPNQYTAAETRANKQAIKLAPTDPKGAAEAQRTALLNNRMAQASFAAQEEVKKLLKYVSKFRNEGTRKSLDLDYLEQIDQLLAAFDPSPSTTLKSIEARQTLRDWVAEQEALGFEPTIDPEKLADMKRVSYKEMTVEELRGFVDSIKEIEHMGRMVKKLLTAIDRQNFQERIDEAIKSIEENANRRVPEHGTAYDVLGQVSKFGRWWSAEHRKFASILREMDGGKDNGVMWNLLLRAMNRAGDSETEAKAAANEALTKLFAPIMKDIDKATHVGNLYPKKTVVPGTDISMTLEQRIMFAMNWGNEGNRQRLLDGGITGRRGISMREASAILDTLTKEQWDFVQGVWDYIGSFRPQIEALERQLTGKTPQWVEPSPIQTKYGEYPGGYFPAKYDTALSTRSESLEAVTNLRLAMKGAFNSAATRNGYTKARAEAVHNRPLLLSFNAISQHVNEVIHRNAWQAWLVDATRTFRALDSTVREYYGAEINAELMKTVKGIAAGDAPAQNSAESFINRVRVGSTVVGMGWSVSTALLQPAGLAQSWSRIGGKWLAKGLGRYVANPIAATSEAMDRSALLRDRNRGNLQRETNEIINVVRSGQKVTAMQAGYFYLIGKMQTLVDIPTWWGAYEKGLAELHYEQAADAAGRKVIEDHAAALADQAVLDSQSGGGLKDMASIQRGSPAQKLWTNFYSYFSATYNLNVEAYRRTHFTNPTEVAVFAADMVLLNIVPVLFTTALNVLLKGKCEPDDTECVVGNFAHEGVSYLFGQMILLREIGTGINVATGGPDYGYSGPAGIRFFNDLYKSFEQAGQGEVDMPLIKSVMNVVGGIAHSPAGQINRTLEGIVAIENGDVDGWQVVPALVFGPPK